MATISTPTIKRIYKVTEYDLLHIKVSLGNMYMCQDTMKLYYDQGNSASDRVIYLFSRIAPKLGLLISMTLRFAGKISEHYRSVKAAQISFRQDKRSLMQKIKSSARLMSSVIQWSLESSVDTADSMKSRGYATGRRTSYHNFRIKRKDVLLIAAIVSSDMMIIYFSVSEIIYFNYYPMIEINIESYKSFAAFAAFAMICIIPLITDIREEKLWKHYGSAV